MVATRREQRLYNAAVRQRVSQPIQRPSRATRRQPKQDDAVMDDAGSIPSTRSAKPSATRSTRQQGKRKATEQDLREVPSSNRINHDNCTDDHCVAFADQTGTAVIETQEAQEQSVVDLEQRSTSVSNLSTSTTPSGFSALPRELRDEIYKHVLTSGDKREVTLQNRNFITKSGLVGVNSQIKEEFLDAVLFFAPVIHTTVRNHNFAHIVTFLNKLSDTQMRKFAAAATPNSDPDATTRSRKIIITLTYSRTKTSTKPQLNRWLDRFDDPKRRGAEVRFEYKLDSESWGNGGYKQRVGSRTGAGPRSQEEVRKISRVTTGRWSRMGRY